MSAASEPAFDYAYWQAKHEEAVRRDAARMARRRTYRLTMTISRDFTVDGEDPQLAALQATQYLTSLGFEVHAVGS